MTVYRVRATGNKVGLNFQYAISKKKWLGFREILEYVWAADIDEAVKLAKHLLLERTPPTPLSKEFVL